jgi:hypothetical protein
VEAIYRNIPQKWKTRAIARVPANIQQTVGKHSSDVLALGKYLRHVPASCIDKQFTLQEFSHLYNGVILLPGRLTELPGIDRNTGVNVVMQCQDMSFVKEIPHQRIEIVGLLGEFDVKIVGEDICDFIETLQSTVVIDHGFGTAEIRAQS